MLICELVTCGRRVRDRGNLHRFSAGTGDLINLIGTRVGHLARPSDLDQVSDGATTLESALIWMSAAHCGVERVCCDG